MMSKEMIVASALIHKGVVYSVDKPGRHHNCIAVAHEATGDRPISCEFSGFVTDTGRYVDRYEGAALALGTGQIEKLGWPPKLYSEDLW